MIYAVIDESMTTKTGIKVIFEKISLAGFIYHIRELVYRNHYQ